MAKRSEFNFRSSSTCLLIRDHRAALGAVRHPPVDHRNINLFNQNALHREVDLEHFFIPHIHPKKLPQKFLPSPNHSPQSSILKNWRKMETSIRYAVKKKNDIIWEFFPNVGPPTPPFWEPLIQKKLQCLFCILEPKEHFCSSKKIIFQEHFQNNVGKFTQSFGNRGPPPPFWEKFPNNPVFFLQQDNSDNFEYP